MKHAVQHVRATRTQIEKGGREGLAPALHALVPQARVRSLSSTDKCIAPLVLRVKTREQSALGTGVAVGELDSLGG